MHYNSTIRFNWKAVINNSEDIWHQVNNNYYIIRFNVSLPLDASIPYKFKIMDKTLNRLFPYLKDVSYLDIPENDFGEVKEEPFDWKARSNSNVILHYDLNDYKRLAEEEPHHFI